MVNGRSILINNYIILIVNFLTYVDLVTGDLHF